MKFNYPDYLFTWSQFLLIFLVIGACLPTIVLVLGDWRLPANHCFGFQIQQSTV